MRIVRQVEPGTIEVYFDNMDKPIMTAVDKTFTHGQVGFGTFDDTANFDDFKLYGVKRQKTVNSTKDPLKLVQENLAEKKAVLIDVREKSEWDDGHLAGAIFLPLSVLKKLPADMSLADRLPKNAIIYAHCRSGARCFVGLQNPRRARLRRPPAQTGLRRPDRSGLREGRKLTNEA